MSYTKNKLKFITTSISSLTVVTLMPSLIYAQRDDNGTLSSSDTGNLYIPKASVAGFSITSLGEFVGALTQLLFILAGVLVFVYLVWGGIQWLTSGGDSGATQQARDRITAALIGLAIIAIAYAIIILVEAFFGITVVGDSGSLPTPWL